MTHSRASSPTPHPRPRTRGRFGGFGEDAPLPVEASERDLRALLARFRDGTMSAWADAAARVGHCAHPIRLAGSSTTIDRATGEVLSRYDSATESTGVTLVACGNRRASVCPACARVYARDTFELLRAGAVGGKTVPASVAENPMLFVTLTAPSFGQVHRAAKPGSVPVRCRPRDKARVCAHGRPVGCMAVHEAADGLVGQPICSDCYDYEGHLVWQWWAPELWRRFTIDLRRHLARALGVPDTKCKDRASIQYAKVAEYQTRGLIHFHALIRLDGPKTPAGFTPAPQQLPARALAAIVQDAAATVAYTAPPASPGSPERVLRFGRQLDVRVIRDTHRPDTDTDAPGLRAEHVERVAGYLAKYATKAASDTTGDGRTNAHYARLRDNCRRLATHAKDRTAAAYRAGNDAYVDPYALLIKWVHMLGFRGHFSSKSRRYSVTLGRLRRARRRWQALAAASARTGAPIDTADLEHRLLADEEETTLVVGSWAFLGAGWSNPAETALANAAAARAREYAQWRTQHHHENH